MASNEKSAGRFLRRLLEQKSVLDIAQSLIRDPKPLPQRVPGGRSVSPAAIEKRWQLLNISDASRAALLDSASSGELDKYRGNVENCIGTVDSCRFGWPVTNARNVRVRRFLRAAGYYRGIADCIVFARRASHYRSWRMR
jgi:hypothetical protein